MSLRIRLLFNFPTYKVLAVSIISIIVGVASISLSVIGLVNQIWGHYVATGIWSGSVIAISGFFGIASAQTRGVCVVKTFMMFSMFSCLASFGVIALSVGGLIYGSKFYLETVYRHPNTRLIHGMLLGTGTLQTILSLICSIICIKHVCCRPKPKHPPVSQEEGQIRDEFRRGTDRGSQSSSAPLMSKSKKRRTSKQKSSGGIYVSGEQPSTSGEHLDSAEHHSRERKRDDKKRNKGLNSSQRSNNRPTEDDRQYSSDRERRHSSEREKRHSSDRERRHSSDKDRRERSQRASVRQHSPDRYANKPDTNEELVNEGLVEQACVNTVTANRECLANNGDSFELISNDMEGLPPYEEVIRDDGIQDSFIPISITDADFEGHECISLSSHGNVSRSNEFTEVKQVDAEQEALLCLSAALQSPVISNNSGISDLLSDHIINGCNLSSLSENSIMGSDNKLSTELVIQDELDDKEDTENDNQDLSFTEKQALLQKYHTVDPDPQGVMYKEFSRGSDFIKETIVTKPKRSKSFQQTRERDFARGKSVSTRQLSCDTEKIIDCSDKPDSFRSPSKSFSRTSSVPGKPPPKPPRTSSLRQHNLESKERPKSATLPYSQLAIMKILDEGKHDTTEIKQPVDTVTASNVSEPTREEFREKKTFDISKIQPPKFRYPRAKLTDETFKEPINTNAEAKSIKPLMEISKQFSVKNEHGTKERSYNFPKPSYTVASTPYLPSLDKIRNSKVDDGQHPYTNKNKDRESLSLSLSPSSNAKETLKSPLKSPTDYSVVPLKEILLKGQSTNRNITSPSNEREHSSTSDASSEESSIHEVADDNAARADINHEHDRDSQNLSDTEGKPMYSFLL